VRFFVCLLDPAGHPVPAEFRRRFEAMPRSRGIPYRWEEAGPVSVLLGGDGVTAEAEIARRDDWVAIGTVRLDNRTEVARRQDSRSENPSDLELMLGSLVLWGPACIPQMIGDFAFVMWNVVTHRGVGACDAFAVKKLYYLKRQGVLGFASRGEALALDDKYNVQYLAEIAALCAPSPGVSVYDGVTCLPGGNYASLERGDLRVARYWEAEHYAREPAPFKTEQEAIDTCRTLLADSVRCRLTGLPDAWAHLSGGLDSSTVVSIAQSLAARGTVPCGLAGTVTYVDTYGTGGDEREYSEKVARRWQVRNEQIVDAPVWRDENWAPPFIDEPNLSFLYFPRDCRLASIVLGAGGRVLLTGGGGDTLFTGTMLFFADWLAKGRLWPAIAEMARRAAIGRASFWELAYRNALMPLLPAPVRNRLVHDHGEMPPWINHAVVRKYGLATRATAPLAYAGRIGHKYRDALTAGVEQLCTSVPVGVIEDALDVRHPYLHRPLVEFALRLPPDLCVRPHARKWILREAGRDILPDAVRTRIGKGTNHGLLAWSAARQRSLHEPLVQNPILAELGVVDARKLRAAFEAAPRQPDGREKVHSALQQTLVLEAWLRMRSGRWPSGESNQGSGKENVRSHALI
jgi:asparagine synthase (glutamine-hydrolysing)